MTKWTIFSPLFVVTARRIHFYFFEGGWFISRGASLNNYWSAPSARVIANRKEKKKAKRVVVVFFSLPFRSTGHPVKGASPFQRCERQTGGGRTNRLLAQRVAGGGATINKRTRLRQVPLGFDAQFFCSLFFSAPSCDVKSSYKGAIFFHFARFRVNE